MKVLSQREGFDCDHSSVSYEFISDEKISEEAKNFARESSHRFKIGRNKLEINIPGENYLYDNIQDTLLEKHNIPVLIYEDYDWWNFLLMFDYDEKLMKKLKEYGVDSDHSVGVCKKDQKIRLWITVHLDYGGFDGDSHFEELGDLFLDIRKEILEGSFGSLEMLKNYCEGKKLSEIQHPSDASHSLIHLLDTNW